MKCFQVISFNEKLFMLIFLIRNYAGFQIRLSNSKR